MNDKSTAFAGAVILTVIGFVLNALFNVMNENEMKIEALYSRLDILETRYACTHKEVLP